MDPEAPTVDATPAVLTVPTTPPTTPTPPAPGAPEAPAAERLAALERELAEARRSLRCAEVRSLIDRAVAGAGAIDAQAVGLVVEAALRDSGASLEGADGQAVARVLEQVRRTRPVLFRAPAARPAPPSPMAGRVEGAPAPLADAAAEAVRTGDRASLLHYLRLRRGA